MTDACVIVAVLDRVFCTKLMFRKVGPSTHFVFELDRSLVFDGKEEAERSNPFRKQLEKKNLFAGGHY